MSSERKDRDGVPAPITDQPTMPVDAERDFASPEDWEDPDRDRTGVRDVMDLSRLTGNRQASLIVLSGTSAGRMFKIGGGPLIIGRDKACDIVLAEDGVSRTHSRIETRGGSGLAVVDLKSTNGTFVNGVRVAEHLLSDGDKIQIGSATILKFSYQDSLEESFIKNQYEQAVRDDLTGAFNKRHFLTKLREEFAYARRHNEPASLIIFDIDHFKRVNDKHGHQAGDMVLRRLVEIVGGALRIEDVVSRYGGEEFTVILRNQDEQRAFVVAERLRKTVETSEFVWDGARIPVTISLGVVTLSERFQTPEDMVRQADDFLYVSKRSGRNRTTGLHGDAK